MFASRHPDEPRAPFPVAWWTGVGLVLVAAICTTVVASLPAPYVIEEPGPTFDVLGDTSYAGELVPMISIPMETTYGTTGELRMLTVYATQAESSPNWIQVVSAFLDPRMAVLPKETVYPEGTTTEVSNEQAQVEMENSQQSAIAAALGELDYDIPATVTVHSLLDGSAAAGVLEAGDVILAGDGAEILNSTALREAVRANGAGSPMTLSIQRGGQTMEVEVTPTLYDAGDGSDPTPLIGVLVSDAYQFPFTVDIQLENVGGPSAGMMFALGIYDKLTPDPLTGGIVVAGTGTIDSEGVVGAIGGIRQKMWGALDAGARWFLAPASNCDDVVGYVPSGLSVVAVSTLDEAIRAVETIGDQGNTASLPTCEAVLQD